MSKYNGWTNYETWCVALWIDNEESTQRHWLAVAREIRKDPRVKKRDQVFALAQRLECSFGDERHDIQLQGMFSDLLTHALGNVAWYEVAEHLLAP